MMKFQDVHYLHSLDELNSAPHGWDVDISALQCGPNRPELRVSASERVMINRVDFDCATLQRGSSPPGMRTFSLVLKQNRPHYFRGREIAQNALIAFPEDRELDAMSPGPVSLINFSVEESSLLAALGEQTTTRGSGGHSTEAIPISCAGRAQILSLLQTLCAQLACGPTDPGTPELTGHVEAELISNLTEQIAADPTRAKPVPRYPRYRVIKSALAYIEQHLHDPITVATLATEIGASRRTLETAFRDTLDVSPKQYINSTRLRGCRYQLIAQRGNPEARVGTIAQRWGFWHLGQFARDYQNLFGELPTHTLHCRVQ
jgi:AraC-like DNA-binding protein